MTWEVGRTIHARMRTDGKLRAETWRDRWRDALAEAFWPRAVAVVERVDEETGTIVLGTVNANG